MKVSLDTFINGKFMVIISVHDFYKVMDWLPKLGDSGRELTLRGMPVLLSGDLPPGECEIVEVKRER